MKATGEIPAGWTRATLGELVQVLRGVTYEKSASRDKSGPGLIPILRATNIGQHLDFDDLVFVPESCVSEEQRLRLGDIVVAASSGSRSVVGKAAPLSVAWTGSFGAFCVAVRPSALVNPRYIAFFFATGEYRERVSALAAGVNINNLKREHILSTPINLAPRNEQDRIVAELDKQFTRFDAGVEALKRVQAQIKRYRASVLKAACEGRLVSTEAELARREKRDYEPADKFLARILKERRARWEADQLAKMKAAGKPPKDDKWKAKYVEPESPNLSELPSLPTGWCWTTLRSISELQGGITKGQKRSPDERLRAVPYLRVANVQRGYLDLSEMKEIEATAAEIEELRLSRGDILFNEGGDRDKLGRGWIWQEELPLCIHQNHVFRARLYSREVEPKFVSHYANSAGQRYFVEQGKQTTNLASINLTKLGNLPVPLPPAHEQRRIVAEIDDRLSLADAAAGAVAMDCRRAEKLRQAILKAAFAGELATQNPNDEPASKLLERISAAVESKSVPKQGRAKQTTAAPKMKATR
ncbi:type I restriction enzyme S subunit [Archangium gephyra]|uniref:Type I restriction enzyme S subunit n=1 Tax=Archangium gephyra TaxID=48 RepID=A0AAC8QDL8_9BACT|nr:restriction endonuclease subunit S [Archangium gephyra]AKJ05576.1 Type I restriction-modification system, specificity subunit S [Archangium gephyra]REG36257.1 type I restriction enzyme S subunit [Archangium gephyra]